MRGLVKDGFRPLVVSTEAAQRFVMPLTFAAVSQAPVLDDESAWQAERRLVRAHRGGAPARVMVVAPATANTLAKMAAGIADNLLTAIYLAFRGPSIVAPTMNWAMYEHPATVATCACSPSVGWRCCRPRRASWPAARRAPAAWPRPTAIRLAVRRAFAGTAAGPLAGKKVVVTSGGTRERIDAVRFIGNRSSGKMGRAVADEAYLRGADVVLVTTQPADGAPYGVVRVESADDMAAAVREQVRDADVLVMAAAVADFKPRAEEAGKIAPRRPRDRSRSTSCAPSTSSPRRPGPACSASASPPRPGPQLRARPREEGGQGRRPAGVQRHPRRGRRHRRRRERDHHHHAATARSRCRAPARAPAPWPSPTRSKRGCGGDERADRATQVLAIVEARVANENLRRHMLATEAIMRALAARLGEDPDLWGLAGLAHDLDCEETGDDFARQGVVAAEALRELGAPESVAHASWPTIRPRGWRPSRRFDVALLADRPAQRPHHGRGAGAARQGPRRGQGQVGAQALSRERVRARRRPRRHRPLRRARPGAGRVHGHRAGGDAGHRTAARPLTGAAWTRRRGASRPSRPRARPTRSSSVASPFCARSTLPRPPCCSPRPCASSPARTPSARRSAEPSSPSACTSRRPSGSRRAWATRRTTTTPTTRSGAACCGSGARTRRGLICGWPAPSGRRATCTARRSARSK